jgi:hypothetical protein
MSEKGSRSGSRAVFLKTKRLSLLLLCRSLFDRLAFGFVARAMREEYRAIKFSSLARNQDRRYIDFSTSIVKRFLQSRL